jgi:methyl-accepting chemotaxis protein-1 (serine sensor receptor)
VKNLKISTQLSLLVGVLSVMLLGVGLMGLWGMNRSNAALKTVYQDRTIPIDQLSHVNALQLSNRLALTNALLQTLPAAEAMAQIEANSAKAGKLWDAFMATHLTAQEIKLAKAAADANSSFIQEGLLPSVAALRANNSKEMMRLQIEKVRPLSGVLSQSLDALTKLQIDEARVGPGALFVTVGAKTPSGSTFAQATAVGTGCGGTPGCPTSFYEEAFDLANSGYTLALNAGSYTVNGDLTLKGRTQPLSVPVVMTPQRGGGWLVSGRAVMRRSQFDIGGGEWADPSVVADDLEARFKILLNP